MNWNNSRLNGEIPPGQPRSRPLGLLTKPSLSPLVAGMRVSPGLNF